MNWYKFAVILRVDQDTARMTSQDMPAASSEEAQEQIRAHFAKESPRETVMELRELSCTPMVKLASLTYQEAGYR